MSEGTGNALPGEVDQVMSSPIVVEPLRRSLRWPAWAGLAGLPSAGAVAAGLSGDVILVALSAVAPSLICGSFFFFGVVCPAIWSRRPRRQKAALAVMASLLGRAPQGNIAS